MAVKYGKKKRRKNLLFYTIVSVALIFILLFSMVKFFYRNAEEEAYEMLHIQTKQIKDDLTLQIKSDRENLITMASFAAKLYADGENYDIMFKSFKPIGLFSNIGILKPDNTFVTRVGEIDLGGRISFADEAARGEYISGRVPDLTRDGEEIIRSAVPIKVNEKIVGILYGVIKLETINKKYSNMAKELDAQLFVFDTEKGNYIIDSISEDLGNVSELENRQYNDGYTYEELVSSEKGFSSFMSIRKNEELYVHYSTIEDFGWKIMLARYESQVFQKTTVITRYLTLLFFWIILVVAAYILLISGEEKRENLITQKSSEIRKLLLDVNQQKENISRSLEKITMISKARSAVFVDLEGEEHNFVSEKFKSRIFDTKEKTYIVSELFRYVIELRNNNRNTLGVMSIKADKHLMKTNHKLFKFFNEHKISGVTLAAITHNNNSNVSILFAINPRNNYIARKILEEIAVCFSIAIYNKKNLSRTYTAATTDSLTDVLNRVAYKKDLVLFDEERPEMFSCIYIDVNELHLRNNKYGHAAGDEMLIYIANALKGAFFGHKVYRMGGDEFLVFVRNTDQETVKRCLEVFIAQLDIPGYKVAIGVSFRSKNTNTDEMVREAEIRMYEAKALYYQSKQQASALSVEKKEYIQTKTGILEIDAMISVLKEHYNGIYRVSLENDTAHRILMPSYLGYKENEENFSKLVSSYINDFVHPDFHRAVTSFLNYETIKRQITDGKTPSITYNKINGETVTLSVYKLDEGQTVINDTLWVFAKA